MNKGNWTKDKQTIFDTLANNLTSFKRSNVLTIEEYNNILDTLQHAAERYDKGG